MLDIDAGHLCPACGCAVTATGPRFIDHVSGVRYHPVCLVGMPPAIERAAPVEVETRSTRAEIAPLVTTR